MQTAACYLRVSTSQQKAENQLPEVEALAKARGYAPSLYVETVSGYTTASERPKFSDMLRDVKAGKHAAVVVWRLDRLGRSMRENVNTVLELKRLGVRVMSVKESWLDTDGPVTELLIAIFSWVAQEEGRVRGERQRAGVEAARARGVKFGRPRVSPTLIQLAVDRVKKNPAANLKKTAEAVGVSERSLRRALVEQKVKRTPERRRMAPIPR